MISKCTTQFHCPWWSPVSDALTSNPQARWERVVRIGSNPQIDYIAVSRVDEAREIKIVDRKTGDLYKDDTQLAVAIKSALIALAVPFYGAALMGANCMSALKKACLVSRSVFQATRNLPESSSVVYSHVVSAAREVVHIGRSPIYVVGIMLAGIYGTIKPYEGRAWIARLEKNWHGQTTYEKDCCYQFNWRERTYEVCYLALCMQPGLKKVIEKSGRIKDGKLITFYQLSESISSI